MNVSTIRSLLSTAIVFLCLLMSPLQSALAENAALTRVGAEEVKYNPRLTYQPTSITATVQDTYGSCVGLPLGVTTGRTNFSDTVVRSCEILVNASTKPEYLVLWGDATSSGIHTTQVVVQRPNGSISELNTGRWSAVASLGLRRSGP